MSLVLESSSNSFAADVVPLPLTSRSGLGASLPCVSDGGGLPAPQRDGLEPMSKSSVPPRAMSSWRM